VVERFPGGVTGDGLNTVAQLLVAVNGQPLRGKPGSKALLKHIPLDGEALSLLQEQGLDPQSVVSEGVFVRLRRAANVARGGTPVPVLDPVHPDNLALVVRATRVLRLDLAGVDLLIPDIRRSWLESGAAICEVNAQPQLWSTQPAYLLGRLVQGQGRIPVVVVLGLSGDGAFIDGLRQTLSSQGWRVGMASPIGASIDGHRVRVEANNVFAAAQALICDPSVDLLLLCLADDGLLRTGLPVDRFDVLVLAGAAQTDAMAPSWPRWRGFALALLPACNGPVNSDCAAWQALRPHLAQREVQALGQAHIAIGLSQELQDLRKPPCAPEG
jgi:cyanophycin synthetase